MSRIEDGVGFPITAVDVFSGAFNELKARVTGMRGDFLRLNGVVAAFTGGLGVAGFAAFIKNTIDAHDQVNKLSQKLGIAVGDLSTFKYAAGLSDVSTEALGKGIKGLSQMMVEATDGTSKAGKIMAALGVDVRGGTLPAIEKMADVFARLPDGPTKAALAVAVFGKSGMDMIPLLNQGSEGIRKMRDEAVRLGLVMSDETAKAAEQFNDNMKAVKASSGSLGISLLNETAPALLRVSGAMKEAAADGGVLKAVWVGMGGVLAEILGLNADPAVKRIRQINNEILDLQEKIAAGPKDLGGGVQDRAFINQYIERVKVLRGELRAAQQLQDAIAGKFDDQVSRRGRQGQVLPGGRDRTDEFRGLLSEKSATGLEKTPGLDLLVRLQEEYAKLNNVTKQNETMEKTLIELKKSGYKDVSAVMKLQIILEAKAIDDLKERLRIEKMLDEEHQKDIEFTKQRGDALEALSNSWADATADLQLELSLIGLSNEERQKAILLEKARLDIIAADGSAAAIRDINVNLEKQLGIIDKIGAKNELLRFAQDAANAWRQAGADIADSLEKAFGAGGAAVGGMVKAYSGAIAKQIELDREYERARKVSGADIVKLDEKHQSETLQNTLGMYGEMAGAAASYFDKQSEMYKVLHGIEQVMFAAKLAMQVAQIAGNIAVGESGVASSVAQSAADGILLLFKIALGIANQANGDPYSAFARMAAMAGIMVGVAAIAGVAFGGGGGGGGAAAAGSVRRQEEQGTGTVLGDSTAKSESIVHVLEMLRKNSSQDLVYTSAMSGYLRSIETGISQMAVAVARNSGALTGRSYQLPGSGGGNTFSLDDAGIILDRQSIGGMRGGDVSGNQYTDVNRQHTSFWGTVSNYVNRDLAALEQGFAQNIGRVVNSLADSLAAAVGILTQGRVTADQVNAALNAVNIDITTVSFAGMQGEAIQAAIQTVFSSIGDTMGQAIYGMFSSENLSALEGFQRVGEGAFETIIRVASGVEQAQHMLDRWGISIIDWRDIVNTQGDVTTELIRQSIAVTETSGGVVSGLGRIINAFDGTAEEMVTLYSTLMDARSAMRAMGVDALALSQAMITGAGGLARFTDGLQAFNGYFLSDAQRLTSATNELAIGFAPLQSGLAAMGLTVPTTAEEFSRLVTGLDLTTTAGQAMFGALIALAPAFITAANAAHAARDSIDRLNVIRAREMGSGGDAWLTQTRLSRDVADFMAGASWTAGQSQEQVIAALRTISDDDFARYSPQQQALIIAIRSGFLDTQNVISNAWPADWREPTAPPPPIIGTDRNPIVGPTGTTDPNTLLSQLLALQAQIISLGGTIEGETAATILAQQRAIQLAALDPSLRALTEQLWALQDAAAHAASIKQLTDWLDSVGLNNQLSPLTAQQQLGEARRIYEEDLRLAQGGDTGALGRITREAEAYLTAQRAVTGFGGDYSSVWGEIMDQIRRLTDPTSMAIDPATFPNMNSNIVQLHSSTVEMKVVLARLLERLNEATDMQTTAIVGAITTGANRQAAATTQAAAIRQRA